jgi:hypothetical protein
MPSSQTLVESSKALFIEAGGVQGLKKMCCIANHSREHFMRANICNQSKLLHDNCIPK